MDIWKVLIIIKCIDVKFNLCLKCEVLVKKLFILALILLAISKNLLSMDENKNISSEKKETVFSKEECSLCTEEFILERKKVIEGEGEIIRGEGIVVLACNHWFCGKCINSWRTTKENALCPNCRRAIRIIKPIIEPEENVNVQHP
jgi:hypothetical protein